MKRRTVTKLVLPVAGLGKRLRPLTNRTPKALVRINGGPLLDYVLREGEESGIREAHIIVSPQHAKQFRAYVKKNASRFPGIRSIRVHVQRRPLGDGHAVLQAAPYLGNDPVAVRFSDDLIIDKQPVVRALAALYEAYRAPVLLLERVPEHRVSRYGIAAVGRTARAGKHEPRGKVHRLESLVEKPERKDAPSNLAIVGGYIITPRMVKDLAKTFRSIAKPDNDALRIIRAFQSELAAGRPAYGWEFSGLRLDCGTLDGFYHAEAVLKRHSL
jgi:UTP--glucose-1-phosphate uridylyltransferase